MLLLLGYAQIQIRVIGHSEAKGSNTVLHPCLPKSDWDEFLVAFLPAFIRSAPSVRPPPRALRRFIIRGVRLPLIAGVTASTFGAVVGTGWLTPVIALIACAYAVYGALWGWFAFRVEAIGYGDRSATFIKQAFHRVIAVVRRDAYQQQITEQNWFQSRAQLVSIGLEVASGPVGAKHIVHQLDEAEADRFQNWLNPGREATR